MDKSKVAVDQESHWRNESSASASICSGSLVQISSIAIDINCPMEEEEEEEEIESSKHEHFSIRGFVSETRKKDKKKCLPFASEADDNYNYINLPPISAPKFRRWQCSACVRDVADQKSTLGLTLADKSDAGPSSYQNIVVGEKHNFLKHSIQTIGDDEHGSRDSRDVDYNYPNDKKKGFNLQCTEGHKAAQNVMNNIKHACITDKANPIQIETHSNSTQADEHENVSSGSDGFAFSVLPHKRKPKLRSLAEIINEDKSLTTEQYSKTKSTQIEADLNNQSHEMEDSLDIVKVTKSPHRKRKLIIIDEDDIGPLEMDPLIITAKRSKGAVTEAENFNNNNINTCKRVEILETDAERDNMPTLFDLRVNAKTQQQNKARKQKSIDMNRKTRRADTENRKTVATNETGFGNKGNVGLFFKNSLFGKQMENVSDLLKGKRSEEGDYGFYVPPSNKSGPGDCNVQEKVPFLDLSLNSFMGGEINSEKHETSRKHTGIPDLNESFIEKPYTTCPIIHEKLDISALSGKETGREGKLPLVEHQPVQNIDKNTLGASDDIPMEIVELLAKNQHERALDNSRKHLIPETIHNPFRGSPYAETIPGPINFPCTNARSGLRGNIGPVQGFLNSPLTTNSNKSHFGQLSPLTPGQQKMPLYSGATPTVSGPRSRSSEGSDLLWPPRRKNVTFDLIGAQNISIQPNGLEDQSYRDKNANYMKGDGKKAVNNRSLIKEGKIGPGRYKSVGSVDAYSNETIPAMQLLSLMDRGIVSGSSFKVGPNNFLNRQFSPCHHHPRLNKNENQQNGPFVSTSFFAQSGRSKDFPTLLNGVRYSVDSSKQSFSQAAQMPQQNGNSKAINLVGPSSLASQPSRSNLNLEVCTLNRNPADFSIPDAKNEFTISTKDLKPKQRNSSKEKSRAGNVEGPKKQRVKKGLSGEEAQENR